MKGNRERHEYLATYARVNAPGGAVGDSPTSGAVVVKAQSAGEARKKAVHLLRAKGVRYKYTLDVRRKPGDKPGDKTVADGKDRKDGRGRT